MSSLRQRLNRIERAAGLKGPCPVCGGRGRHTVAVIEVGDDREYPEGCPRCGRLASVKWIILHSDVEVPPKGQK